MANTFNDKVWILDTASTTAVLLNLNHKLYVKRLFWKPAAAGQTLTIKDMAAHVRYTTTSLAATPAGDINEDFSGNFLEVEGFILHTMTGGTLYVYF